MWKKDTDEAKKSQSGEEILKLFLIENSRVESIILFSKRVDYNSACANVKAIENKIKNRRTKRNIGNTSNSLSTSTSNKQRSKRGSKKSEKKAI